MGGVTEEATAPGSQPWLTRAVAGRYRKSSAPDCLAEMSWHTGFVFVARGELRLWDRARPGLEQALGEGTASGAAADLAQLYRASRHVAAQVQVDIYRLVRRARRWLGATSAVLLLALPLLTGSASAYVFCLVAGTIGAFGIQVFVNLRMRNSATGVPSVGAAAMLTLAVLVLGYLLAWATGANPRDLIGNGAQLGFGHLLALIPMIAAGLELATLLLAKVMLLVTEWRKNRIRAAFPDVAAVSYLFDVVDRAASPEGFTAYASRHNMIYSIEIAAGLVRKALPRTFALRDPAQRVTLADRCRSAADSLHQRVLWVALPNTQTHSDLSRSCLQMAAALLAGHYDRLPAGDGRAPTRRQRLRVMLDAMRTLVLGAVPLVLYLAWLRVAGPLKEPLGSAIPVFCIGWAVVTYLQALDPMLGQRVTVMRDLVSTVRGGITPGGK
jgi:hypothetical protein